MAQETQFTVGNKYNFTVVAPAILGNQTNVEVLGVVTHQVANVYGDIAAMHASVYGSLTPGVYKDDYTSYTYLLFKTTNGTVVAFGLPWIDENSVEVVGTKTMYVTIPDVSNVDIENVRKALVAIGKVPSNISLS